MNISGQANRTSAELMQHRGRAVVFENFDMYKARINDPELDVDANSILVMKNCGPKGYPGMAEVGNMGLPPKLLAQGITAVCRVVSDRIDPAADHFEPLKTNRCQRRAQGFCRHHGAACMVVEFFEISHDGLV